MPPLLHFIVRRFLTNPISLFFITGDLDYAHQAYAQARKYSQ
jgi:hypothetical protein